MKWIPASARQAGVSLLEILLALAISTSLLIGISSYIWDQTRSQQDVIAAQYQNMIAQAAQNYISDNYTTMLSGSFPASITVSQLISGGYLSSGMSSTNVLGQTVCVKVTSPVSNALSALVMATGTSTTYARAAHIATLIGALGGAVDSTSSMKGTGGSWVISSSNLSSYGTCSSGSMSEGQFASFLYFANGSLVSDFLHRSYVGSLSANTMNVPLGLSTQTLGNGCSSSYVGFVARDTTGGILSCMNNSGVYTWTAVGGTWKSPVTTHDNLPTTGNTSGDVRITTDTGRSFEWNGTTWQALSVDESGNFAVPNDLTVTGNVTASGTLAVTGAITGGSTVSASGLVSGSTLASTTTATAGAACTTVGALAHDSTGSVLYCKKTTMVWTALSQTVFGTGVGQYWWTFGCNTTAPNPASSTSTTCGGYWYNGQTVGFGTWTLIEQLYTGQTVGGNVNLYWGLYLRTS